MSHSVFFFQPNNYTLFSRGHSGTKDLDSMVSIYMYNETTKVQTLGAMNPWREYVV